jgi:hypothetical protein
MLRTLVDLDVEAGDAPVQQRSVKVGDVFPIVLYVKHGDSSAKSPVEFDTIILEVFFNDEDEAIVLVDPTDRPVAGNLASRQGVALDAFSHRGWRRSADPVRLRLERAGRTLQGANWPCRDREQQRAVPTGSRRSSRDGGHGQGPSRAQGQPGWAESLGRLRHRTSRWRGDSNRCGAERVDSGAVAGFTPEAVAGPR